MLNWKPRNKFRPYISNSMNKENILNLTGLKKRLKKQCVNMALKLTNVNQ